MYVHHCASTQAKGLGGLSTPLTVTESQAAVEAGDAEGVLKGAKAGDVLKRCVTVSPCQGIIRFRSNKRKEIL